MKIVPNPTASSASVQLALALSADASLEVLDVHGRILLQQSIPAGAITWSIDALSSLTSGMYTVRLATQGAVTSSALVIMR